MLLPDDPQCWLSSIDHSFVLVRVEIECLIERPLFEKELRLVPELKRSVQVKAVAADAGHGHFVS